MTTRDPRSRDLATPGAPALAADGDGREHTLPLPDPDEPDGAGEPSPDELAFGTHDRQGTKAGSPRGRARIEAPRARTAPPRRRDEDPADYQGAVLGSYRVLELLGKGGMGYVYRAEHVKLGREVALKLLRRDYASRRDAVARFFQEARTVNRVRHHNIVDVTDLVELDDGTTFIIMELLTGTSLGAWARSGVELPRALAALIQICDGLGAAHQVGVVHRDLKPDNVIVVPTSDGGELVKLLDFGVAKLVNRDDEDVGFETAAGSVIGTPAYMSPEQAGGMLVDARSDIYSLGAIMYELFCGQPMFRGRSFGEYVRKHLTEIPVPPRRTPGGIAVDPALEAVILRCLEKDPAQRFAHILELRDALRALLVQLDPLAPLRAPDRPIGPRSLAPHAVPIPLPHPGLPHSHPPSAAHPASSSAHLPASSSAHLPASSSAHLPSASSAHFRASSAAHLPSSSAARLPSSSAARLPSSSSAHLRSSSSAHLPSAAASGVMAPHDSQLHATSAPASPWWIWLVGGVTAVAIGVGAAVWYAKPSEPSLARRPASATAAAAPIAGPAAAAAAAPAAAAAAAPAAAAAAAAAPAPAAVPAPAAAAAAAPAAVPAAAPPIPSPGPRLVGIRVDSLPTGSLFAEGQNTPLCRTPCTFNIDLRDGGPTDWRSFAVKRAGYIARVITVDLNGHDHAFRVVLEPARDLEPPTRPDRRPSKRTTKPRRDAPAAESSASPPPATAPVPPPPPPARPAAPKKPPAAPAIDPADTLDPFRNK